MISPPQPRYSPAVGRELPPHGPSPPHPPTAPRARREPATPAHGDATDPGALGVTGELVDIALAPTGETERVGRYVVRGVLGRGGMGVVYEVEAPGSPTRLALKTVETRFLELSDGAAAQRFRHEIKVLERLVHPSIVRLYDAGLARHPLGYELAYYVMEKLDGDTLVPGIKSGTPYPVDEALRVAGGLAEALDYLQKNGVLHRDIKPGNVFLETSGRVVLVDFGLARSQEFTRLTLAGQIVGTFSYMSPERLAGQPVDVAADVFAAGVVFFQMLTGRHPFGAGTPPELMAAIHRGVDWPESFARLDRSADLKVLLTAMLALDARQRPQPALIVERVRALRQPRRPAGPRHPVPARTATESLPSGGEHRAGPTVEARPAATVLIDAGPPRPARDPAITARGDERTAPERAPISARTAAGGPTWMMFGLAAGSIACLAFTGGLLVGSFAPRPADHVAVDQQAGQPERADPTTTDGALVGYAALVSGARDAESRGDVDETIRLARAASAVNPADAELHRILGDAYAKTGASAEAVQHYRRYVALRPSAPDVDVVRAAIESLSPR